MSDRWSEDEDKVATVLRSVEETYSGPWGLKADSADVIRGAAEALGVEVGDERRQQFADALWTWEGEQPSPFAEGLASLIDDGLAPGSVVPTAEIAGDAETEDWEVTRAKFIADLIQNADLSSSEGAS